MKYISKFRKFMYGRYGPDELYRFLFGIYIFLLIVNLFVKSKILTILELFVIVWMFYRFFSRNIYQRSRENQVFLNWKKKVLRPFKTIQRNYRDRFDYLYKKCSSCKTTLRLPLPDRRGIHHVKCPKCGKRLTIFSLRRRRQEIINAKERIRV